MDLFLVSKTPSRYNYLPIIFAGIGTLGLIAVATFFNSQEDNEEENEDRKKMSQGQQKPAGIYNQGNTCFVNSVLQTLSSIQSFQTMLKQACKLFRGQLSSNQQMVVELSRVIDEINQSNQSISVSNFLNSINEIKQGLINLQQQDAHELYTAIISSIECVLNKQKNMDLTASCRFSEEEEDVVENPLVGYIKTSTTCTTCKTETSIKIDPFYDISLDISKREVYSLKTALFEFQKQERIDHWTCTTCSLKAYIYRLTKSIQKLRGSNKQKLSFTGKAILDFLQNKEFSQFEVKEINSKLSQFVTKFQEDYQKLLDDPEKNLIFRQIEGVESSIIKRAVITKYPKILVLHVKQLVINPYTGEPYLLKKHIEFQQSLEIESKRKRKQFALSGILTHLGNELYGHYIAFRRANRESEQWYMISDSMSKKTNWQSVQKYKAYMLFYESK